MSELPKGWAATTIGEITDISSGFGFPKHLQGKTAGRFPFAKVGDISNAVRSKDGQLLGAENYVDDDDLATLRARPIPAGSTVFAKIGEALKLNRRAIARTDLVLDNNCMAVSPKFDIEPDFVFQFMKTVDLGPMSIATTVPSVRRGDIENIQMALPPAPEQRRIVAKLDSLRACSSRARQELDHIPKLIERYKQAILAKAFSGELTAEWRHQHGLPEWDDTTIGEIGEVMLGRQRSPANHNGPHMRPYVRAANITWRGWDLSDVKSMNFDERDFARFELKPGDVLVNEGSGSAREVGKPAIWRGEIENCCFQNTLIKVRPVRCTSDFLHRYILWCARSEQFVSSTQGVNIYHIGKEGLAKFTLKLPHRDEQLELVHRIDTALAWLDKIAAEHSRADNLLPKLDQAILAKAFRGELVPQDPNDEPASALLARINQANGAGRKPRRASAPDS